MSTPFGISSSTANVDINVSAQHSSHGLLATGTQEEPADEPPSHSRKQVEEPSLTGDGLSTKANTPTAQIAFDGEKLEDHATKELAPRKIRFKVPLTLPRLSKRSRLRALFTPSKPIGPDPTYGRSLINILKFSPLNVLLVFIPISWVLHRTKQADSLVFATSALGVLPLAALLGFGTEQIAIRTSSALAGLLNASLGNLTELIIAGICLSRCQLGLVQSTLLGGLFSNLLLVLGMAFLVGGIKFPQLSFRPAAAQLNASLLTVGVISMLVPTAFHNFLGGYFPDSTVEGPMLLELSRGFSIVLMIIYFSYLGFQFYTHSHLFLDMDKESDTDSQHGTWGGSSSSGSSSSSSSVITSPRSRRSSAALTTITSTVAPSRSTVDLEEAVPPMDSLAPVSSIIDVDDQSSIQNVHYPLVNTTSALLLLVTITAIMYPTAENLVDSLTALTDANPNGISKEFLSVIVLPVLSNGAELSTAVYAGFKGKFDLVLGVAVGSCIQITLFVIPLLVCVAWGMGKPLSLLFDPLETTCFFLTVLLVKFVIEDGRTHWLNGLTLVCVYVLLATTFWHFPTSLMGLLGGNQTLFVCSS